MSKPLPSPRFANRRRWHSERRTRGESGLQAVPEPSLPPAADRYRGLFENSPISLWEEDFSECKTYLDELTRSGIDDLRGYLRENPDEVQRCASLVVVVDVNAATLELLECDSKERLLGRLPIIFRKASYDIFLEELLALAEGKTVFEKDVVNHTFRGKKIEVRVRLTLAPGHEQSWSKVFVSLTDITELKRTQAELSKLAQLDTLTGLPNRYTFDDRLEREAIRAARRDQSVAVLMLDIDHFKDVNDLFGHPVGDAFLVKVAERLSHGLRSLDTVARLGGDEFAVLQTEAGQPESTASLAQRLISILEQPFEVEGYTITSSASVGVAIGKAGEIDPRQLIRQADMALYRAKQRGRGTFRFYGEEMDQEIRERLTLSRDLRLAIDNDELFVEFQPQIELVSGRVAGVEALLRWRHPEYGLVSPGRFIPIAENNGFIVPLGDWVLRAACEGFQRLRKAAGGGELKLAVNLSAVQVRVPQFAGTVLGILESTGVPPQALELEMTESLLMQPTAQLKANLEQLHSNGIRFAIDDFGTGYSSMNYLRHSWVHRLKIDRSFLQQVEEDPSDAAIVTAVIALGNKLGLKVLAEGVEREGQLEFLHRHGCDEAQGYYLGRPTSVAELSRRLAGR